MVAESIQLLETQGYVKIPNALTQDSVKHLLKKINYYCENAPQVDQSTIPFLNRGHEVVYNLQNKDVEFIRTILGHQTLRALLMKLLNDEWYQQIPKENPNYILRTMVARNGKEAGLPLHIDSFIPNSGPYSWIAQVSFVLEDQYEENGCTIVVPGSHKSGRYATPEDMKDAIPIISKAGDMVLWDSRLWHGTTNNTTSKTRWAMIATFARWWVKQSYDVTGALPREIYHQLTNEEKSILGFCSCPPRDEMHRIDIKAGYEVLETTTGGSQVA